MKNDLFGLKSDVTGLKIDMIRLKSNIGDIRDQLGLALHVSLLSVVQTTLLCSTNSILSMGGVEGKRNE